MLRRFGVSLLGAVVLMACGAGTPALADYQFDRQWGGFIGLPAGVATDSAGNVYGADRDAHRIMKFTSSGTLITAWGSRGKGNGQFNTPLDVAVDSAGNVFVADSQNGRIQKFTSDGQYMKQWGLPLRNPLPVAVATDRAGNVYVIDDVNEVVQAFTCCGRSLGFMGGGGSDNGKFKNPGGVATNTAGYVYVADSGNNRIQKFTSATSNPPRKFVTKWGSRGSGYGQFLGPSDVATDTAGNVFVADGGNSRIDVFNNSGGFITKFGNPQTLDTPSVATDSAGNNIYVSDPGQRGIQKWIQTCGLEGRTPSITC